MLTEPESSSESEYEGECHEQDWQPKSTTRGQFGSLRRLRACCVHGSLSTVVVLTLTSYPPTTTTTNASTTSYLCSKNDLVMSQTSSSGKKSKRSDAGKAGVVLLEAVSAGADAFGPLKSAASGALYFAKLIEVRSPSVIQEHSVFDSGIRTIVPTKKIGHRSKIMSRRTRRS